jgi:hypothetical protein
MKTFFDPAAQQELLLRLDKLTPDAKPIWGRMNSAQMLTHCTRGMKVPLGELSLQRSWLRFVGRIFKKSLLGDRPFSRNSPTAPEFVVRDERSFGVEKAEFLSTFRKLAAGQHAVRVFEHGFFGPMSTDDWGLLMYKHTDHHFRQFGV